MERLNPALPPDAVAAAVDELSRNRSVMGLPAANREVYRLLKEGIPVSVLESDPQDEKEREAGRVLRDFAGDSFAVGKKPLPADISTVRCSRLRLRK